MKESLVNRLKAVRKQLTENMVVDERLWTRLVDNGTITDEHARRCKAETTEIKKIELLLDMLERRDDSCFEKFCQVLCLQNTDLVKKYLDVYSDGEPLMSVPRAEVEDLDGFVLFDRLQNLRDTNASLLKLLEKETTAFTELEVVNSNMQDKLEEAKNDVRNLESQHQKEEETYENNRKELEREKVVINKLEKEIETLEAEISQWKANFNEKDEQKKHLEEELNAKTLENTKLGKRIAYHKTHLSSLGSRSFNEDS